MPNLGQNQCVFFVPCDLEIWRMTLKKDRAPFLTYSKFVHHFVVNGEFKLELRAWKCPICVKIIAFFHVTLIFDGWSWRAIGRSLFYATWSYVHYFVAICVFNLQLWSGKTQNGTKFALNPVTLTFCTDITFVHSNNYWKFHDEHSEKRVTDGRIEVFLKMLGRS